MTARSHATAVLASRAHLVYRVDGAHEEGRYWAYVLVDAPRLEAFQQALASGSLTAQDYGKVLVWGQGSEPPPSAREQLKRDYNFDVIA